MVLETGGNVRATHILNVMAFIKRKMGQKGVDELLKQSNWKLATQYTPQTINEVAFVPYDHYLMFLREADILYDSGDLSVIPEIGAFTVSHLGTFDHLLDTSGLLPLIEKVVEKFDYIYDFGKLEIAEESAGRIVLRYKEFPKIKEKCLYLQGSIEEAIAMCGIEAQVEETLCNVDEGVDHCEFVITWKE